MNNMKKRLLLFALPAVLVLSGCSNINLGNDQFKENTTANEKIFGEAEVISARTIQKHALANLNADFVDIGYQTQYDSTKDELSIRYVAAIKDANVKAVWRRGLAKGDGTETKAFGTKTFESKKMYQSLKNGTQVITAGEGDYAAYQGFAVYTLAGIPYTANKDSYLAAYLTLTDPENETNTVTTNVYAIKVEQNNNNQSVKTFNFANNTNGYFLQGKINGTEKIQPATGRSGNNKADYTDILLNENDSFGSFYFDGSAFQYFNYDTYFDHSLGFFNEASLDGYVTPKLGGKYTLYVSGDNNNWWHIYTSASYFDSNISMWLKPGKWEADGARFVIHAFNDDDNTVTPIWRNLTLDTKDHVYRIDNYDSKTYPDFLFARMGTDAANISNNIWNQTRNLHISDLTGTECCLSIADGDPWNNNSNDSFGWYSEIPGTIEITDNSGFSNINDNQVFDIHTTRQAEFLAYQGNYDEMDSTAYPDGNDYLSNPEAITLTFDYTAPNGKTVSKYSVIFGQRGDLNDGYRVDGNATKSISFYNPYLGRNYYKLIATFTDNSTDETPIRHFDVNTTYPRNLKIEGLTNCRDMGGRVLADGGRIRQGLVYRTSGNKFLTKSQNASGVSIINTAGTTEMLQHLKVKTEVNVADGTGYNLNLSGTTVKNYYMDYSGGSHHFSRNTESVKNFFNLLGDSNNYPVFFHCRIGTDRTGLCAILFSGLLGVELNDIYQDYLFSNFGNIEGKRYIGPKAGADNIMNYISDIQSMPGETFKHKVYNTLLAIGVSRETLDTIISNLTEGTLASDYDKDQVAARADVLTGNGVSVTTDNSDRDHPDKYFVLNSTSKSVSYNFTSTKEYTGTVVAYLGNTDANTSKKIGDAIGLQLDNNSVAIRDVTYADARMGKCSSRMNYFPVILGSTTIGVGSHTVKITGTSNTMNIGGIYIYNAGSSQGGGGQGGEEPGDDPTPHVHSYNQEPVSTNVAGKNVYTYLCDCGHKYIDIKFTDYTTMSGGGIASDGKIGGDDKVETTFKWDIPVRAGRVYIMFNLKMSYDSHSNQTFNSSKYTIKANGVEQSILLQNGSTYGNLGLTTTGKYFNIAEYEAMNDQNLELVFVHKNSDYRLLFTENVRIYYAE